MKRRNEIDAQSKSFNNPPQDPYWKDAASLVLAMQYNHVKWFEKQVLALDRDLSIPFTRLT
jgi:hypothetical protein